MMRKRKNTRNRRRVQLVILCFSFIFTAIFLFNISAVEINAESDLTRSTYKYYTSVYVERGDSLWSIAEKYITKEYKNIDMYINEVKSMNDIKGNDLQHGSYICIPYYSSEHK